MSMYGWKKPLALALSAMGIFGTVALVSAPVASAEGCYNGIPYVGLVHPLVANMTVRSAPRLSGVKQCDSMSRHWSYRAYCYTSGQGGDWAVVTGDNGKGGYVPLSNLMLVQDGPLNPC
jgi:hypothetical protein